MSFQGRIEDVAIADVMQLIRLGGHSGSLSIHAGEEEALIGFERGRLVSGWSSRSLRLGELLLGAGALDEPTLQRALEAQEVERPRRAIGQILVRQGATTPEIIRQVIAREIERVVKEVLAWPTGTFDFALDDLTPVVEVSRFSGSSGGPAGHGGRVRPRGLPAAGPYRGCAGRVRGGGGVRARDDQERTQATRRRAQRIHRVRCLRDRNHRQA